MTEPTPIGKSAAALRCHEESKTLPSRQRTPWYWAVIVWPFSTGAPLPSMRVACLVSVGAADLGTVTVGSFVGPLGKATVGRPAGLAAWVPSTWVRPRRTSATSATTTMVSVPAMPSWLLPSAPKPLAGGMEKTTREPFVAPSSPSVKPAMRSRRPSR